MNRIYHNHKKWEEVKYNMYGNTNQEEAEQMTQQVIDYFKVPSLIEKWMAFVIDHFTHSCEHNFTNPNMNHIAWLGQASVAAYLKIPAHITRNAWNFLDEQTQNKANKIAKQQIKWWFDCRRNI